MRIAHFDTDDLENPLRGGQPVRTFEINSRLAARHDIRVFTAVYRGCVRATTRSAIAYRRLGVRIEPFGLSPHLSFLAAMGPRLLCTPHDLVIEEFTPPVGFCLLPWWTRRPVISIVQWNMFELWERRYHLPFSRWMRFLARRGWYRHFIVQTDALGRMIEELIPSAVIRKIPCGVNGDAFLTTEGPGDCVLFLGRLDIGHKGLDLLLAAWQKVCAPCGIPLVIAGDGEDRQAIETEIQRLGLEATVRCVGRVEGESKRRLLRSCRLLAMPSRYETFGITALEAMAAGRPVAAFDIPHLNELVRPAWGGLVPPFDALEYGRCIRDLWNAPDACRAMGERGQREAARYAWDRLAVEQENFYLDVLKHAHPKF